VFERALFATDLSAASFSIIDCNCFQTLLQQLDTKECVLATYLEKEDPKYPVLEMQLEKQKKVLERYGLKTFTINYDSSPVKNIPFLAGEHECDYVMLGSQGECFIKDSLLGPLAFEIIHNTTVPVFLFRLEASETSLGGVTCSPSMKNILDFVLFATDFSKNAEPAHETLLKLIQKGCNDVELLHVQENRRIQPYLEHQLEKCNKIDLEKLQEMRCQIVGAAPINVRIRLCRGSAVHEILQHATEINASLILMGVKGSSDLEKTLMGSVSQNVARLSTAPILLVP